MLVAALKAEVDGYIAQHADDRDEAGHALVVRNGVGEPRKVTTAAGELEIQAPRLTIGVRDAVSPAPSCRPGHADHPRSPKCCPCYTCAASRSKTSNRRLAEFFGSEAGLSASTIQRLTREWAQEWAAFQQRDLTHVDYVYLWADGVHFNIRLEQERLCCLVLIGVRADGHKELIAVSDGYRESINRGRSCCAISSVAACRALGDCATDRTAFVGDTRGCPSMLLGRLQHAPRPDVPLARVCRVSDWCTAFLARLHQLRQVGPRARRHRALPLRPQIAQTPAGALHRTPTPDKSQPRSQERVGPFDVTLIQRHRPQRHDRSCDQQSVRGPRSSGKRPVVRRLCSSNVLDTSAQDRSKVVHDDGATSGWPL